MKKIILIFTLVTILFLVPISRVRSFSNAITDLNVSVIPEYRAEYGEYRIRFVTNKDLRAGIDKIYLKFPDESNIPCTSCAYAHCSDCFMINGTRVAGAGIVSDLSKTVYFVVPSPGVKAGETVELLITQGARFENPNIPGDYKLIVWTDAEPERVEGTFTIKSSTLKDITLRIDPEFVKVNVGLYFSFKTGDFGDLWNGQTIYIKIPEVFSLPKVIISNYVTVNGNAPISVRFNDYILSIRVPVSIQRNSDVKVNIYPSFGIVSPVKGGEYTFEVWSDTEPVRVRVNGVIKEKDFVKTVIETIPSEPDGLNGFYRSRVTIKLEGETNTGEEVKTYYKVDDSNYMEYKNPFTLSDGEHIVSFFSETKDLKEDENNLTFKIDTISPTVKINLKDTTYTYENNTILKGSLNEDGKVFLNGDSLPLDSNFSFQSTLALKEGNNYFHIKAVDLAGNESEYIFTVVLDTTTPVLTIDIPKSNLQLFKNKIEIKGSVYPQNCYLFINDKFIEKNPDGSFDYFFKPTIESKLVPIDIKVVYPVTNRTYEQRYVVMYEIEQSIKLQVNSKLINVFGEEKVMDVAPFIEGSTQRTLVPIRFIAEAFGLSVSYSSKDKTIHLSNSKTDIQFKIGDKTAIVNGIKKTLDVAPMIKDNRTFVSVRFVAEILGYKVSWDDQTKSVTITP